MITSSRSTNTYKFANFARLFVLARLKVSLTCKLPIGPFLIPNLLYSTQVILHIVNHLNHFPLAAGAARLTSIVNENQDNPYCTEEQELTAAVFSSPNVQVGLMAKIPLAATVILCSVPMKIRLTIFWHF